MGLAEPRASAAPGPRPRLLEEVLHEDQLGRRGGVSRRFWVRVPDGAFALVATSQPLRPPDLRSISRRITTS
jgi:hypothetical protein